MTPPLAELELYASLLEETNVELERDNSELRTNKAMSEATILARGQEIKRLRQGLIELGFEFPDAAKRCHDLMWKLGC